MGDFVDDYRVDPILRNDLGLLWFFELDGGELRSMEALPLKLDYCHTRIAEADDAALIKRRLIDACAALGTAARERAGRVVVSCRRAVNRSAHARAMPPTSTPEPRWAPSTGPTCVQKSGPAPKIAVPWVTSRSASSRAWACCTIQSVAPRSCKASR